jgi:hypothetical protein
MTFEEINLMLQLEMGRATYWWTHSNEPEPKKSLKNSHQGEVKIHKLTLNMKEVEPNRTPRILMPLGGEQNKKDKPKR